MLFISWVHWVLNWFITMIMARIATWMFPEYHAGITLGVLNGTA